MVPTLSRFQVAQPLPHYSFVRVTPCGGTQRLFKTDVFAYVTALDPQPQESSYGRWLTSFWWIVVMVVMTGFTGIMKANMMVKDQTGRINTIQDIIARPNLRALVISGSTYEGIFKNSDRPDYQRLWRQVLRWNGLKTAAEMVSKPIFDIILEEKATFFCDDTMLYMTVARLYPKGFEGEFYMGNDYFINNEFTMFIRRGLDQKIINEIHKRLRWVWEAGLPQEWKRRAMESARSRSASAQTTIAASNMKLTDVGAIFYLLFLGHGCACLGVLAEVLSGRLFPAAARSLQGRMRRRAGGGNISRISPLTAAG
ncbi:hypothetical protein HPB48_023370 [Haemaphysalis longicornis]|uniref:Ionotropic glutamate receptor C-terminal domain-containing protein n=1 Tax=Haemaphysalis longicornis TaxID=44386 RepID=A0A9J6H7D4_HAELO|nr:hypothetical protein HPB48_023370 [Haemaphysalis longicornis]